MINKWVSLLTTFLCFSFLGAEERTLIVGTNGEFPPFSYIEDQQLVGFDIDVAKEVGKHIGVALTFKDMPFEALLPELILGRVDFVAAGLSATEERAKRVNFTKPYLESDPFVIFTKADKNYTIDDLKGKKVVVIDGFTADQYMSEKKGIDLIRLPVQADGFLAIKTNRADAFITAKSTVDSFFLTQDPSQYRLVDIEGTGENCAIAVPKQKEALLKEIQAALDEMETDGTMQTLKDKWGVR